MKKGLFTLFLMIMAVMPALAAPGNTTGPWGIDAGAFSNLSTALASPTTLGKTVVVSKPMAINNKTTNRNIRVILPGSIDVNATKTLTTSADIDAGRYRIFNGSGSVAFTSASRAKNPPEWYGTSHAAIDVQNRSLVQNSADPNGAVHAYEDKNVLNFTSAKAANYNAYAAFDANTNAGGVGSYDHLVGFQARQTYSGSNEIWSRFDSFVAAPVHSGTGTVAKLRGLLIENPGGAGPITDNYGIYINPLTRGTNNYGIYSLDNKHIFAASAGSQASLMIQGNGQTAGYGLSLLSNTDSTASVWQSANADLLFGTNNIERLRITAAGVATLKAASAAQASLGIQGNGQSGAYGFWLYSGTDSTAKVWQTANADLVFATNNVERFRIKAAGFPVYADNAAALSGGLIVGTAYRTSIGQVMVVY